MNWIQVLGSVPGSSMVLLSLPQDAIPNLQREARERIGNVSRFACFDCDWSFGLH